MVFRLTLRVIRMSVAQVETPEASINEALRQSFEDVLVEKGLDLSRKTQVLLFSDYCRTDRDVLELLDFLLLKGVVVTDIIGAIRCHSPETRALALRTLAAAHREWREARTEGVSHPSEGP